MIVLLILNVLGTLAYLMELILGVELVGWAGDNMILRRQESPGPYWFAIGIQTFMLTFFVAVYFLSHFE